MQAEIKVGDLVDVWWENLTCLHRAKVLYIPCATGDSWRLLAEDGALFYVQTFCALRLANAVEEIFTSPNTPSAT